jgi:transcription antitermination protein NusB
MGARSAAREAALQMLYAAEFGSPDTDRLIGDFWREFPGDAEGRSYADPAVRGVLADRPRIDAELSSASTNWRIERMNPIARNVLRLGTWELMNRPEIPRAVIIDESVEVAKRYAGTESAAFVNGVLDRLADSCGRRDEPKGKGAIAINAEPEPEGEDEDGDDLVPAAAGEAAASDAGAGDALASDAGAGDAVASHAATSEAAASGAVVGDAASNEPPSVVRPVKQRNRRAPSSSEP